MVVVDVVFDVVDEVVGVVDEVDALVAAVLAEMLGVGSLGVDALTSSDGVEVAATDAELAGADSDACPVEAAGAGVSIGVGEDVLAIEFEATELIARANVVVNAARPATNRLEPTDIALPSHICIPC